MRTDRHQRLWSVGQHFELPLSIYPHGTCAEALLLSTLSLLLSLAACRPDNSASAPENRGQAPLLQGSSRVELPPESPEKAARLSVLGRDECRAVFWTERLALSAAHCVQPTAAGSDRRLKPITAGELSVRAGKGPRKQVLWARVPAGYPAGAFEPGALLGQDDDLALVLLKTPEVGLDPVSIGRASGEAFVEVDGYLSSVRIIDEGTHELLGKVSGELCRGDSGAPLWATRARRTLVAIYTRAADPSRGCDAEAVFTRLDRYVTWLDAQSRTVAAD